MKELIQRDRDQETEKIKGIGFETQKQVESKTEVQDANLTKIKGTIDDEKNYKLKSEAQKKMTMINYLTEKLRDEK